MGGHDTVTGVNNIQYTAQFGNGVSGAIGLDDPTVFNRTVVGNLSVGLPASGSGAPTNTYGGTHAPDIVGNIRVDQAWGLFQISGAAHLVNASYNILTATTGAPNNLSEISGHPDDKWGGSVMAALQIKNLPTGAGDDFKIDVSYAKGNTKNVISTSGGSPTFLMFGGSSAADAYQSVGLGLTTDAIYSGGLNGGATNGLKLTEAWGVRVPSTTTGIPTGRPAFGAATLAFATVATCSIRLRRRARSATPTTPPIRRNRWTIAATPTSTSLRSVWSRVGLPSRT